MWWINNCLLNVKGVNCGVIDACCTEKLLLPVEGIFSFAQIKDAALKATQGARQVKYFETLTVFDLDQLWSWSSIIHQNKDKAYDGTNFDCFNCTVACVYFSLEMFFYGISPYGLKAFGNTPEKAQLTKVMAKSGFIQWFLWLQVYFGRLCAPETGVHCHWPISF